MLHEYTIMVVDDDDDYCFVTKLILKRAGVGNEIITASNGLEALELLTYFAERGENQPDVILLDLKMPIMDGLEFLEEASKKAILNFDVTKVFVNTSSVLPKDKEKAFAYPIAGFVPKPLSQEIIKQLLL